MSAKQGKKIKFPLFACIIGVLGIMCCVAALSMGAYKKDNWLKVSKRLRVEQGLHETPVFVEAGISVTDAAKLELDVSGGNLTVNYYDGDEVLAEYYEDYEGETVVAIENGKLIVKRDSHYGSFFNYDCSKGEFTVSTGFEYLLYKEYLDIKLSLPRSLEFSDAEIDVSGGSASINGVVLGQTKIDVSGGSVKLTDCILNSVQKIDVSGGSVEIKNSLVKTVKYIDVSGGSIKLTACEITAVQKIDVSGGTVALDNGALSGKTQIHISGGVVNMTNLDVNADCVGFDVSTSGGSVYFNGTRIKNAYRGTYYDAATGCLFDVHVSGGRFSVSTK